MIASNRPIESVAPQPFRIDKEQYCRLGDLGWFRGQKVELIKGEVWNLYPGGDAPPAPRRWSKAEYYQLAEMGWFRGMKAELIDGEIMVQSPQNPLHSCVTDKVQDVLRQAFGPGYWTRMQLPLDLRAQIEPEPDVSVVSGSRLDYVRQHPTQPLLIVEVSESSLSYDRNEKASLYASSVVRDYWIVNLIDLVLEVHRNPVADSSQAYGWRYADVVELVAKDTVSPLAVPQVSIAVRELLP
ncbi:MAG: Uma2 family endonuclease [Gemmataceae bacterium]